MEPELSKSMTESVEIAKDTGYLQCAKEIKDLMNDIVDEGGKVRLHTVFRFLDIKTNHLIQKNLKP